MWFGSVIALPILVAGRPPLSRRLSAGAVRRSQFRGLSSSTRVAQSESTLEGTGRALCFGAVEGRSKRSSQLTRLATGYSRGTPRFYPLGRPAGGIVSQGMPCIGNPAAGHAQRCYASATSVQPISRSWTRIASAAASRSSGSGLGSALAKSRSCTLRIGTRWTCT